MVSRYFSAARMIGLLAVWSLTMLVTAMAMSAAPEEEPYVIKDGVVDWYTYSGFRRYHAECHVCHGPDGLGSSFGPNLVESLKTMDYGKFIETVAVGRSSVSNTSTRVMPSFGNNLNVVCYMDDIYAYLKARADGALGRGRPSHEPKPEEAKKRDEDCMGQ